MTSDEATQDTPLAQWGVVINAWKAQTAHVTHLGAEVDPPENAATLEEILDGLIAQAKARGVFIPIRISHRGGFDTLIASRFGEIVPAAQEVNPADFSEVPTLEHRPSPAFVDLVQQAATDPVGQTVAEWATWWRTGWRAPRRRRFRWWPSQRSWWSTWARRDAAVEDSQTTRASMGGR